MSTLLCWCPFLLTLSSGPHCEGGLGGQKSSGFSGMYHSNPYFRPPNERYLIPHLVCGPGGIGLAVLGLLATTSSRLNNLFKLSFIYLMYYTVSFYFSLNHSVGELQH